MLKNVMLIKKTCRADLHYQGIVEFYNIFEIPER